MSQSATNFFLDSLHPAVYDDQSLALWVLCMAARNAGRPWTSEEDAQLIQAVQTHGDNDDWRTADWRTIANSVPGRTNKACRKVSFR